MGRRPRSLRATIWVGRVTRLQRPIVGARWIAGAMLLVSFMVPTGWAASFGKGSSRRADRAQAVREIPFKQLTVEARRKISPVVEKPSLFRRMPNTVIDCDPQMYRFLIRYPEVIVNIWQLMGITKVTTNRVGPYTLDAKDGVGTVTNIELIYGDQDVHLMYCEGNYEGPLLPRPLTGRCVLLLKSDYEQTSSGRWKITNRMDVFLQIDNMAVDVVARTFRPLLGKSADLNFVQSTRFLERVSKTSEENGPGMNRLARRLDNVGQDVQDQFARLTQSVNATAQRRSRETVARNATTRSDASLPKK